MIALARTEKTNEKRFGFAYELQVQKLHLHLFWFPCRRHEICVVQGGIVKEVSQ